MKQEKNSLEQGYTMIELMIVVAIIGVLIAIVVPLYRQNQIKTNRSTMQTTMVQISQKLESYKSVNNSYSGATLSSPSIYGGTTFSSSGVTLYTLQLVPTASSWTLTAMPTGTQAADGYIVLNDQGQRCWTQGTTCTPSATTNWVN